MILEKSKINTDTIRDIAGLVGMLMEIVDAHLFLFPISADTLMEISKKMRENAAVASTLSVVTGSHDKADQRSVEADTFEAVAKLLKMRMEQIKAMKKQAERNALKESLTDLL